MRRRMWGSGSAARGALMVVCLGVTLPWPAEAQVASPSLAARSQGLVLLSRGLEAMGGLERLGAVRSVLLEAEVTQYQVGQAPDPDSTVVRLGMSVYALLRDLETGEWYLESSASREAPEPGIRVVKAREDRFQHDLRRNAIMEIPEGLGLDQLADRLPWAPSALLEAWRRAETVRLLPRQEGAPEALTYADSAGRQVALTFGEHDRLRSVEIVESHAQFGDLATTTTFSDYRPVGDLMLPFASTNAVGSMVTIEARLFRAVADAPVDATLLRRPEGVPAAADRPRPTVADGAQKVEEIVPGVYQILNVVPLYNVMFVQQQDGVVALEAPGDDVAHAMVRDSVAGRLEGARIATLVLTHHHFDHTSDLRNYLDEGARVVAPAGNGDFVRAVAGAPRATRPRSPRDPDLDLVEDRRTIGTGSNRFEVIDVGPNPHADHILVAYFPEHRLLWVPDIYGYLPGYTPPPLLLSFADRLAALDLDVDVIATAHTELSSMAELREMVERVRTP